MTAKHYLEQYFVYDHLRPELQVISRPFGELVKSITAAQSWKDVGSHIREFLRVSMDSWPHNEESEWAIGKLRDAAEDAAFLEKHGAQLLNNRDDWGIILRFILEAKDCAVRASFYKEPE